MSDAGNPLEKLLSHRRFDTAFLPAACITAVLYRGWDILYSFLHGIPDIQHISFDGVYYAQIARNLLLDGSPGWEAMIFPVLQPVIVAALSAVTGIGNYVILAQLVNTLAGALALVPVYFITARLFDKRAAVFAVLLIIPFPQLVAISTGDTVESLYSFLVYASLWSAMLALERISYRRALVAGLLLGLAYLSRPEGLIIFFVFLPVMLVRLRSLAGTKKAAIAALFAFVSFWAVAAPYAVFLSNSYGRLVLSCKLPYESIKMREAVMGLPLSNSDVYGITKSGRLTWQEYGGTGVIVGYIKSNPKRFFGSYLRNLASQLPWKQVGNSSHLANYPNVYPIYFWIPALLGLIFLVLGRKDLYLVAVLLMPYMNMFAYPVFTSAFWLYNAPYLPTMVLLATGAVIAVFDRLRADRRAAVLILTVCTAAWWVYSVKVVKFSDPKSVNVIRLRSIVSGEERDIGRRMRKYLGTDVTYMSSWSRMVYYMGGRWVEMPAANDYSTIRYALRNNVDYIVEELKNKPRDANFRFMSTPGLSLIYTYKSDKAPYAMAIWKITDTSFYR